MNENSENIENIEKIKEVSNLRYKVKELETEKQILLNELTYFKNKADNLAEHCKELASENLDLNSQIADLTLTKILLSEPVTVGGDY